MLKAIRHFDRKTREGLLADLALHIGRPGTDDGEYSLNEELFERRDFVSVYEGFIQSSKYSEIHMQILREINDRLNLGRDESLYESKARVMEFLGKEIRGLALESAKISAARKRLGQKGMLPPAGYRLGFAKEFSDLCEPTGIKRQEVARAVNTPHMVEHFMPDVPNGTQALSLYAWSDLTAKDPYTLLVDTWRVGDGISVHYAVRVFHSDIDVTEVTKPTDLLRAFTERFGEEFTIGDQTGKLLLYTMLPDGSKEYKISFPNKTDEHTLDIRTSHWQLSNGSTEVAIAYGVNVDEYVKTLRSHGVTVSRKNLKR